MFTQAQAVFEANEKSELNQTLEAVEKMKRESRERFNPVILEAHGISMLNRLVKKMNSKRLSEKRKAERKAKKILEGKN